MCCRGWGSDQLYCMTAVLLPSSVWAAPHSHDAVKYTRNPRVDGSPWGFGWVWFVDKNKFKLICWVRKWACGQCDIWVMDSLEPQCCCTADTRWSALTPSSPTTLQEDTLRAKLYCFRHINKTFNEDIYSTSHCDLKLRVKGSLVIHKLQCVWEREKLLKNLF